MLAEGGGSVATASKMNVDAFVAQANAFDAASRSSLVGQQARRSMEEFATHPLPILRARELERWASSSEYNKLLGLRGKEEMQLTAARSLEVEA